MKQITISIKWFIITMLLFLSGFNFGSQFFEHDGNLFALDWSIPLLCWLGSWIIHELSQLFFTETRLSVPSDKVVSNK